VSGNNILSRYYQRKYSVPYKRFLEKGILKKAWGDTTLGDDNENEQ
jgi:hypothetical protein